MKTDIKDTNWERRLDERIEKIEELLGLEITHRPELIVYEVLNGYGSNGDLSNLNELGVIYRSNYGGRMTLYEKYSSCFCGGCDHFKAPIIGSDGAVDYGNIQIDAPALHNDPCEITDAIDHELIHWAEEENELTSYPIFPHHLLHSIHFGKEQTRVLTSLAGFVRMNLVDYGLADRVINNADNYLDGQVMDKFEKLCRNYLPFTWSDDPEDIEKLYSMITKNFDFPSEGREVGKELQIIGLAIVNEYNTLLTLYSAERMDDLKTGVEFLKCLKKEKDRISRPIGNKEYLTYIDLPGYLEILENF